MKDILKAFGYLGIPQVAAVLFGLVRSKLVAAYLGPIGTGVIAQGTTLLRMFQQLSTLGIGSGFLKLIAEYRGKEDHKKVNIVMSTVMGLFGIVGLMVVALSVLFAEDISLLIFDDPGFRSFVIIIAAASWIFVQYSFIMTIFRAFFMWREYSRVAVMGYALNLISTVVLIIWLDLLGAVLSIFFAQVSNFIVGWVIFYKQVVIPEQLRFWKYMPSREMVVTVVRFIGPLTTVSILPIISLLYVRSEIIRQLGLEANGIFQVVWGISVTYIGLISMSLGSYGVPKVASLLDKPDEITKIQNHEIRLGIFVVTPIIIILAAYREYWIPLLHSQEFLAASGILIWQLGADYARIVRQTINITLVPHERFRFIYWNSISIWGGWMLLTYLFLPSIGLAAVPISYFLVNVIQTIISIGFQRSRMGFQFTDRNKLLLIQTVIVSSLAIVISQYTEGLLLRTMISSIALVLIVFWIPTKNEKSDIIDFAKDVFSQRNKKSDLDLS